MGLRHPVISVLESGNNFCLNVDNLSSDDSILASESTDERIRAKVCQYHCQKKFTIGPQLLLECHWQQLLV